MEGYLVPILVTLADFALHFLLFLLVSVYKNHLKANPLGAFIFIR